MIAISANRIPNFAGVALVDILANGVAVLIIVVVLSIAEREEQEKHFTEKVKEVSAVMTREFSTSLVLNRLAASSPAVLHDYENSELDQFWDPVLLPIIEFHNDAIRDPYSGKIWPRSELLEKPNSFDDFLFEFTPDQAAKIRGDIYDVGTYYLANSILSDYGMEIKHWHFIGSEPGKGSILQCPPDVMARDCVISGSNQSAVSGSEISLLLEQQQKGEAGRGEGEGDAWPPSDLRDPTNTTGGSMGPLPNDVNLGSQSTGQPSDDRWGSFPDANETRPRGSGTGGAGESNQQESDNTISFRLADPRQADQSGNAIQLDMGDPSIHQLLAGLMAYIDELQAAYDNNLTLEPLLQNFAIILNAAVTNPPQLTDKQTQVIVDLGMIMTSKQQLGQSQYQLEPLFLGSYADEEHDYAVLRLLPNRLIFNADTNTKDQSWAAEIGREISPRLNINGHPGIWRGVQITLHRSSVLMIVPEQEPNAVPSWRAAVYVAPKLNDFIVGFIYSAIDKEGRLLIPGESNQVRLGSFNLIQPSVPTTFGVRTWLFALYFVLGISFVGLLFFWRPNLRSST